MVDWRWKLTELWCVEDHILAVKLLLAMFFMIWICLDHPHNDGARLSLACYFKEYSTKRIDFEVIYFSGFDYKLGLSIADYSLGESRMILPYQVVIVLNKIKIRGCEVVTDIVLVCFLDHFTINLLVPYRLLVLLFSQFLYLHGLLLVNLHLLFYRIS